MYSYEDRLRAVQLYIKLGKQVRLTIRQLGYPTKNALKSWYRAYERSADMPAGYARQPRYTQAQRDIAVEHYREHGRCLAATIRALGYPSRPLLSAWVQELEPEAGRRVVGRSLELPPAAKQSAVIALCMREASGQSVAKEVGVSRPTLYKWKHQLLGHDTSSHPMPRRHDSPPNLERDALEQQIEALRRNIRHLQLEQDLLKKANELLKKDFGIDQQLLTNREKTELVDALRPTYTLNELLSAVGLPRSSFFYHLARLEVADKYVEVRGAMIDIFDRNYRCYGYRRLHASLTDRSLKISEKVVRRLMKQESLVPVGRKRRRYGSYMGEISPAPDNLLNRDFSAEAPNEKWLTDITEFQIPAGKVYLSPMIDCYDGMVVSWSIGTRPDAELVNTMLDAAIETVAANSDRPVVHSDRGGHYRWPGWLSRIAEARLVRSMSRKACSPDNAACEGFFGRLKNELFYSRDWLSTTIEEFVAALDAYIRWYNEARIKMSLGYRSPMQYRKNLAIAS
jgi:transposase InsO family protein/transposase-like protein